MMRHASITKTINGATRTDDMCIIVYILDSKILDSKILDRKILCFFIVTECVKN
jgi:hypothetical protein